MRLFLGIDLNDTVKAALRNWQPPAARQLRLVPPELFHLTLHFIGAADPEKIGRALVNLHFQAFDIEIAGRGYFGRGKGKKVLWAGVGLNPELADLYQRTALSLSELGIAVENHVYQPHITLARSKGQMDEARLKGFLHASRGPLRMQVRQFVLFSSEQHDARLVYRPLSVFNAQAP